MVKNRKCQSEKGPLCRAGETRRVAEFSARMGDDELRETKGERRYWWIACACTCILIVCPLRFWEPFWTSWNSAHFFLRLLRTFYCLLFCDISKLIKSSCGRAFTDYGLPQCSSVTCSLDYWPHVGFQKVWQVWCLFFTAFSMSDIIDRHWTQGCHSD